MNVREDTRRQGHGSRTVRRIVLAAALISVACFAASEGRQWQIGKVLDAQGSRSPRTGPPLNSVTIKSTQLRIVGKDYDYLIDDTTSAQSGLLTRSIANRKHGCRFVVGDEVKYAQEKDKMYVVDTDGKECKLDILRQERVSDTRPKD
jgi:predicted nucleic acid-binding Zn finger protein